MKLIDKINPAAQGEITIYPKPSANPETFLRDGKPLEAEHGKLIIGHSETGHHHVIAAGGVDVVELPSPSAGIRLLRMIVKDPLKELIHERPHDTHETIGLNPGMYEVRIGREYDPYAQLARRQMD